MNETTTEPGIPVLPRLLAVEVLLSDPDELYDDTLESCLYILRERLQGKSGNEQSSTDARPGD
jgi:hypothetical protein